MPSMAAAFSSSDPPARTTPVPSGLDSTRTSPGRPPPFVKMRSGWTRPCTASPKIGSSLRMVWPPTTEPPAARTVAAAAARMASMASMGRRSGKAETFSAVVTRPPMAKTSLQALAAAIAPKSAGSSTRGGKKSVVDTTARSSLTRYTAASSNGARPTSSASSVPPASSRTRPDSGAPPHFAAQPPQAVHSVSRSWRVAGVVAAVLMEAEPRGGRAPAPGRRR